jgi:hypothetical protein
MQWLPGVKRPGHEGDQSPPSSTEFKMRGSVSPLIQNVSMAWCVIKQWMTGYFVKHRDNFTLFNFVSRCMVLDTSNTAIMDSNPARGMDYVHLFLCCNVLCRQRPRDGPIPRPRNPTKMSK